MSKNKIDIGSNMSFKNTKRKSYSLEDIKEEADKSEKIVKISIDEIESAPKEWNFYPKLDENDFNKLVISILEHGLLHPIVVRKTKDANIVLSGHNRLRAYKTILEDFENLENNTAQYVTKDDLHKKGEFYQIMSVLKEDITDDEAREIIIDANFAQRQLGPKLMMKSVVEKYKIIKQKRNKSEEFKNTKTRDIVAKEFNLSGRHIDRYKKLENLQQDILDLFYEQKISLELASKIATLKPNVQNRIAKKYIKELPKYPSKISSLLKSSLSEKKIDEVFDEILPKDRVKINITINGKSKNIVITDEKTINKILNLVKQ